MEQAHRNNIHTLLLIEIAKLDEEVKFDRKAELTYATTSDWMKS